MSAHDYISQVGSMLKKGPLGSKKWISSMTWSVAWFFLLFYGIKNGIDGSVLSSFAYCAGAIQVLYLGGQSALDSLVRRQFIAEVPSGKVDDPGPAE